MFHPLGRPNAVKPDSSHKLIRFNIAGSERIQTTSGFAHFALLYV